MDFCAGRTHIPVMCGKFTQLATWSELVAFSEPLEADAPADVLIATPMRDAWIIRLGADGKREAVAMRWGFPAANAQEVNRLKHVHARGETLDTLPRFRGAFAQEGAPRNAMGRGILVVKTFNEGEEIGKRTKQWTITPKDGAPLAIAVLWEEWEHQDAKGSARLPLFVQVTTPANKLIAPITDRMPAILRAEDWASWLGETNETLAAVKARLATFEDEGAWEIAPENAARGGAAKTEQAELF